MSELRECPDLRRLTRSSWSAMLARCENPRHPGFLSYAGRGIRVCQAWHNFDAFLEDVGLRPGKEYSLDRVNNDGNYEPSNVRWATREQQHRNKRNNRNIEAFGKIATLAEWAEITGIRKQTIRMRLERGWNNEDALSSAPQPRVDGRPDVCVVPGCGRKHNARGYCGSHLWRVYFQGDANPSIPIAPRTRAALAAEGGEG